MLKLLFQYQPTSTLHLSPNESTIIALYSLIPSAYFSNELEHLIEKMFCNKKNPDWKVYDIMYLAFTCIHLAYRVGIIQGKAIIDISVHPWMHICNTFVQLCIRFPFVAIFVLVVLQYLFWTIWVTSFTN